MTKQYHSQCPFQSLEKAKYTFVLKEAPRQHFLIKLYTWVSELLSKISIQSIKIAWLVGKHNDSTKMFEFAWKKGSLISKCHTLKGTIYVTADPNVMKVIYQNPRSKEGGLFWDKENTNLFIRRILSELYPDDIKKFGIPKTIDMIVFTARQELSKLLRAPLVEIMGAASVRDYLPQMNKIADDLFASLSEAEKMNCDGEQLSFEFAMTIISKLITGYEATREDYIKLANALNSFSKKMTSIISHRPLTQEEENEYQQAMITIREVIDKNLHTANPSLLVMRLKELGWNEFQIRANLFFMYFAGTETTASSINYLLWQLGKPGNEHFLEKLRDPKYGETFLSKLIGETLRLHPASFIQGRQLRSDTLFEAYDARGVLVKQFRLQKNHAIVCLPQLAGLDSATYNAPLQFNPDRFNADDIRAQLAWHPFGAGTHVCPGQYLALAELRAFISRIAVKFTIQLLPHEKQMEQKGFITLRATPARIKLIDVRKKVEDGSKRRQEEHV